MSELSQKKVLALVTNRGVEQDELKVPAQRLRDAGVTVHVAAPQTDDVQSLVGDWDLGESFSVDLRLDQADPADYDLLLLPGGTLNADALRIDENAQRIVRHFAEHGKPVASICHGPWLLVESDVLKRKALTSYVSIKTDVINAGGQWHDTEVYRCPGNGWVLITSRNPGDLDAFVGAIEEELTA